MISFYAGLFLVAAADKLIRRAHFRDVLRGYRMLPDVLVPLVAILVPVGEISVAGLVILAPATGAITAAILLGLYGIVLLSAILRGVAPEDCGCAWGFGPVQGIHWSLVLRNALLVAAVLTLAAYPAERPASMYEIVNGVGAAGMGALLWAIISALAANRKKMKAAGHV